MKSDHQELSISDLSTVTGVSTDTLRYYEREGLMIDVPRRPNGHRVYDDRHVRWIGMLRRLRAVGMPISAMGEYVALARRGPGTLTERLELLEYHKVRLVDQMEELEEFLAILERKIRLHREERPGADCLVR